MQTTRSTRITAATTLIAVLTATGSALWAKRETGRRQTAENNRRRLHDQIMHHNGRTVVAGQHLTGELGDMSDKWLYHSTVQRAQMTGTLHLGNHSHMRSSRIAGTVEAKHCEHVCITDNVIARPLDDDQAPTSPKRTGGPDPAETETEHHEGAKEGAISGVPSSWDGSSWNQVTFQLAGALSRVMLDPERVMPVAEIKAAIEYFNEHGDGASEDQGPPSTEPPAEDPTPPKSPATSAFDLGYWRATADHCYPIALEIEREAERLSLDTSFLPTVQILSEIIGLGTVVLGHKIDQLRADSRIPELFANDLSEWCADELAYSCNRLPVERK